ncbi:hypothetical protein [Cupriavidus gilardii]|uniref:Uncharacterized protein n=2 Tax=Cupriavidus gilardii TaxID=82541 RepID=A0A849B4Y5_9BURK|nr:hypothetical protein [Cupriavidus gilardii]KAB0597844.1 hypothetical protein F7Q96_07990 [Cupriavidus gilardii]NNH10620.1 hypothetical protein [Cupriavidus gilardii]
MNRLTSFLPVVLLVACSTAAADYWEACGASIPLSSTGFEALPSSPEDATSCSRFYRYAGHAGQKSQPSAVFSVSVFRGDLASILTTVPSNFGARPDGTVEFQMPEVAEQAATGFFSRPTSILNRSTAMENGVGYMIVEYGREVRRIEAVSEIEAIETKEKQRCTSAIKSDGQKTLMMSGCIPASGRASAFNAVKNAVKASRLE